MDNLPVGMGELRACAVEGNGCTLAHIWKVITTNNAGEECQILPRQHLNGIKLSPEDRPGPTYLAILHVPSNTFFNHHNKILHFEPLTLQLILLQWECRTYA